jgi:hypothetical protein
MTERRYSEELVNHWIEHICGEADNVYRLAMGLGRSRQHARKCLVELYRGLVVEVENLSRSTHPTAMMLGRCWDVYKRQHATEPQADPGELSLMLRDVSLEERLMLASVDSAGLTCAEASSTFGFSEAEGRKFLAAARGALCQTKIKGDLETLFSYSAEYLDGELPEAIRGEYLRLAADHTHAQLLEQFQVARGKFQIALSEFRLKPEERVRLHDMVEDKTHRETQEAQNIDQMGHHVTRMNTRRTTVIVGGLIALVVSLWYSYYMMYARPVPPPFEAVEILAFQVQTNEADGEVDFNLPSADPLEIEGFFTKAELQLGFAVPLLKGMPPEWRPQGASIEDFDGVLVPMVQFVGPNDEKLTHFVYKGELSSLPAVPEKGNYQGLIYQTYAADTLILVAWQSSKKTVSFLIGHRPATELAGLAKRASSL